MTPSRRPRRVIALAATKGGVAKSVSAVSLAAALTERGQRVLVIDLDPQGNAAMLLRVAVRDGEIGGRARSMYPVLMGEAVLADIIVAGPEGFDFAPAAKELALIEKNLPAEPDWATRLSREIADLRSYDVVIIDTPPAIGVATTLALVAATDVIVPIELDYLSARSLPTLLDLVARVRRDARGRPNLNPELRVLGVLPTKVDLRTVYARDFAETLRRQIAPLRLLEPGIRQTVVVREASARGMTILRYRPQSAPAVAYRALADEVLRA